jgi:hypothetical protein
MLGVGRTRDGWVDAAAGVGMVFSTFGLFFVLVVPAGRDRLGDPELIPQLVGPLVRVADLLGR